MRLKSSTFRYALDQMPINVMICDAKTFRVTYVNQSSKTTLRKIEKLLPKGVTADNILGQCIDVFHKSPERQRRLLGNKANFPHHATIRLGKEFLDLNVMRIPGGLLKRSRYMLTWSVSTKMEQLTRMVNKMPINVMMCDPETLEISFLNETSLKTLRTIEHLLPVKADEILGSCIDIFHKVPSHQRKLLADPSNLPHRAKIQVGPEWLELNVAAIVDDNGGYIGAMVSWSVITKQVEVANAVRKIASAVASASSRLNVNAQKTGEAVGILNNKSASVSESSTQASDNVHSVAIAAEQLSASVKEIAMSVGRSKAAVGDVAEKVDAADRDTRKLGAASQSMTNIVEMIQEIAGKINLLALNASVESARAGEAGKGFAVVASEIKALANQTTLATEDISKEIENMQGLSRNVGKSLTSIKSSVDLVGEYFTSVASSVEEQSVVTRDISSNMHNASSRVGSINDSFKEVTYAARDLEAGTDQVRKASRTLSEQSERLNAEIESLLN